MVVEWHLLILMLDKWHKLQNDRTCYVSYSDLICIDKHLDIWFASLTYHRERLWIHEYNPENTKRMF
jgi:hypothetical protein